MKRFSTVKPEIKKRLLIKGMTLSFVGIILLIGMGTFATVDTLLTWGIPSFFLAIFLIGIGLIPYRNLTRLETHPHQLIFEKDHLIFISTRGNQLTVPYQNIDNISYTETMNRYGIRLDLKEGNPLFFPYFSDDPSLNEIVHPNQSNETV